MEEPKIFVSYENISNNHATDEYACLKCFKKYLNTEENTKHL